MTKWTIMFILCALTFLFFGISLDALFTFDEPYCYVGIPGAAILGYIIGDWIHLKFDKD